MHLSLLALLASVLFVKASPVIDKRCVFSPTITSPVSGTVWTIGANQTVTWATDNLPDCPITSRSIVQLLQCNGVNDSGQCKRQLIQPFLATDFDLTTGSVNVTVPSNTTAAQNYAIILFGDSGNLSDEFSIVAADDTGVTSSSGDDGDCEDDTGDGMMLAARAALPERVWADVLE